MLATTRRAYRLAIVALLHGVPSEETAASVRKLIGEVKAMDEGARSRLAAQPPTRVKAARIIHCAAASAAVARIGDVCTRLVDLAEASRDLTGSPRIERTTAEAESVARLIRGTCSVVEGRQPLQGASFVAELHEWRRRLVVVSRDDLSRTPSPDRAASAVFHRNLGEIVTDLIVVAEVATGIADGATRSSVAAPSG